jgi:hypothetical protein
MSPEQALLVYKMKADEKVLPGISSTEIAGVRCAIAEYLDYMEGLCVAYEKGIIDRDTFDEPFRGVICHAHDFFTAFITVAQQDHGGVFKPIQRVVIAWRGGENPSHNLRPLGMSAD